MELQFNNSTKEQQQFSLDFNGEILSVQRMYIANQIIFHVQFSTTKKPLALTRATDHQGNRFWTSIPQGRQNEAEEIGPLIADYILSTQSN